MNRYGIVFAALTVYLILYRELYVLGFDDFVTAVLSCGAALAIGKVSKGEISFRSTGRKMTFEVFMACLGFVFLAQIIAEPAYMLFENVLNSFGYTMYGDSPVKQGNPIIPEEATALFVTLYPIAIGPFIEEVTYRSYAAKTFEKHGGKMLAIIVSAIAFAIGHGRLSYLVHPLFAGAVFAFLLLEYGLKWATIFHIINNLGVVGLDMLLCGILGEHTGIIANNILGIVLGIIALGICFRRRDAVRKYITDNRPAAVEMRRAFVNAGFLIFLAFNIWKALGVIVPM